jgi:DNA invertase Pin-like site-specific DNA recombinase
MSARAVITYERVSSDRQDIARQAIQRERAQAAFPDAEHRVVQDDGVSAFKVSVFDRPGGAELCALVESGEVEAIFTDAQYRLSRGRQSEWWNFWDLCELNGTRLFIDGQEVRLDDEGDEIISSVRAMLARRESREKSHRTRSGMREAARRGRWLSNAPFGYRLVEQRLVVEPTEAEAVRRVFREYLDGRGITRITRDLRADGVRTRRGGLLSLSRVGAILSRNVYTGAAVVGDEVVMEDAHPAIVDAETFAAAQRLRDTRSSVSKGRGRVAKRHLLHGMLRCPHGHAMIARGGKHDSYICGRRHAYDDCDCPEVSRSKVDQTILDFFLSRHWNEDEERERLLGIGRQKVAEAESLAAAADREEAAAQASLTRVKDDYKRGHITSDEWHELRAEMEEEALAAHNRADQLRARAELLSVEVDAADVDTELVSRLAAVLRVAAGKTDDEESVAAMRAALGTVFRSVTFSPGLAAWGSGTYVSGEADLVPVLRDDLVSATNTRKGGGWVWGTRPSRIAPVRTDRVRSGRG